MPDPLYRQIAEDLRTKIEDGSLTRGQQLQTESELRHHYNASRNTVRDAIKWLMTLGLVESRAGQGIFVADRIEPFVTTLTANSEALGRDGVGIGPKKQVPVQAGLDVSLGVATTDVATRLGLPDESTVVRRRTTHFIGDVPSSIQMTYYPVNFVEAGATLLISPRDIAEGAVEYLAEKLGLHERRYSDLITVRTPDENEIRFFKLSNEGRAGVFEIFRTTFDQNDEPVRVTITVCPTERNQFVVNGNM